MPPICPEHSKLATQLTKDTANLQTCRTDIEEIKRDVKSLLASTSEMRGRMFAMVTLVSAASAVASTVIAQLLMKGR
jgi:hypothetical protein